MVQAMAHAQATPQLLPGALHTAPPRPSLRHRTFALATLGLAAAFCTAADGKGGQEGWMHCAFGLGGLHAERASARSACCLPLLALGAALTLVAVVFFTLGAAAFLAAAGCGSKVQGGGSASVGRSGCRRVHVPLAPAGGWDAACAPGYARLLLIIPFQPGVLRPNSQR